MRKIFCDSCGKEINDFTRQNVLISLGVFEKHNLELCDDCVEDIREFIKTPSLYHSVKTGRIETVDLNMFDKEEIHENCTVQILTNTKTGAVSVGWWENEV